MSALDKRMNTLRMSNNYLLVETSSKKNKKTIYAERCGQRTDGRGHEKCLTQKISAYLCLGLSGEYP